MALSVEQIAEAEAHVEYLYKLSQEEDDNFAEAQAQWRQHFGQADRRHNDCVRALPSMFASAGLVRSSSTRSWFDSSLRAASLRAAAECSAAAPSPSVVPPSNNLYRVVQHGVAARARRRILDRRHANLIKSAEASCRCCQRRSLTGATRRRAATGRSLSGSRRSGR